MDKRVGRGWIGLVIALVAAACACSALGIAGVWAIAQRPDSRRPVEQALDRTASNGTIAYVGADGNLYAILPDGSQNQALTDDQPAELEQYNTLAWSPDGQLAFMTLSQSESALFTLRPAYPGAAEGGAPADRTRVYSGRPAAAPFYLSWSPDSQRIAFLTAARQGQIALWLADGGRDDSAQTIATGSPSYFAWSPDSRSLLMHLGGAQSESPDAHLAIYQSPSETTKLPDAPGVFQAPAWSPQGQRLLFVRASDVGRDELVLAEGDRREALAVSETGIAFVLSPQGKRVAFARPDRQSGMLYTSVTVMDLDTREQRQVARGQIAAFFWSPDGGKLAVLSLDENSRRPQGQGAFIPILHADRPAGQSSSVRLVWSIVNLAAGSAEDAPSFRPTDSFLLLIPYFDQYAQSLSLWSPDSRYLVLADLDQDERAAIRILDTAQPRQPARWLAEGSFAAWSWR